MARKLKTYVTSEGFFEKAIAAPSMKAALEAWGSSHNLFHEGFAKETNDRAIVSATMAHPGAVLKRPVGSDGTFELHAKLPHSIMSNERPGNAAVPDKRNSRKKPQIQKSDAVLRDERKASKAYEREERRREKEREKEEARLELVRKKREAAVAKAKSALTHAESRNDASLANLKTQQRVIHEKIESQEAKWYIEKKKLEAAVEKARQTQR